ARRVAEWFGEGGRDVCGRCPFLPDPFGERRVEAVGGGHCLREGRRRTPRRGGGGRIRAGPRVRALDLCPSLPGVRGALPGRNRVVGGGAGRVAGDHHAPELRVRAEPPAVAETLRLYGRGALGRGAGHGPRPQPRLAV